MSGEAQGGLRKCIFAWALAKGNARYERAMADRKRTLLGNLIGTVVEIGPGTGANLVHYAPGVQWIGIEPSPYMQEYLRKEAETRGLQGELRTGTAERLGMPNASVDAVVSTLVLCSVPSVAAVLKEILRVLKPGGRFVFIEHVAAPRGTLLRFLQRVWRPPSIYFADGCRPDRETGEAIEAAGFSEVKLERFRAPLWPVSPHVAGVAIR